MSVIGKLHEISLYGVITNIICLILGKVSISELINYGFHVCDFKSFFIAYLFWATILFIPIAIIGAYATKYSDSGEGLTFKSNNIVVIIFAHIAEDILGLLLSFFWFLKDLFKKELTIGKIVDYVLYVIELIFIFCGILFLK